MPDRAAVAAVVLAAGASTRMGRTKQLLPVDGVPMVRRAVLACIEAGLAPVVVVVGHDAVAVRAALAGTDCTFAENPDFTSPTSSSLHAGLRALPDDATATIVLLADMVRITTSMLQALVTAASTDAAPLVVSRYADVLAPPLLFRRALWPELLAWHGEGCGKAVVRAHEHDALILDWPEDALQDIDTPADYSALVPGAP